MKVLLAALFALLLHSDAVSCADPTFDELKSQLPITLTPNGADQYFFFIIPVQKNDDPQIILQMAQAQSISNRTNNSIASTMIDTINQSVNVSASGESLDLDKFFVMPESEEESNNFNFQVPVVVPLDFRFTYSAETSSTVLPECSVDTRTWKEQVIARIAEKLQLDGQPSWDHSDLNIRIRKLKDALSSVTLDLITSVAELSTFANVTQKTKYLADIRYYYIINNVTELTGDHVSLMAEGVNTYELLDSAIKIAEQGIAKFAGDPNNDPALALVQSQIDMIKSSVATTLTQFKAALIVTKDLQIQEANAEDGL
ncbi:uncharacterized protein [Macrobrachium rosenbergii]|uniref:uncharacterized protein n=1 Tax=Macrobrachium rosenbergii TaxID=79674 RepID=UPI0034D6979E